MRKVMLQFKLVGRSFTSKRKKDRDALTAKASLDNIKSAIELHFGNRPMVIVNENIVFTDTAEAPEFYSAGWFVSDKPVGNGTMPSELVVVATGSTMQAASANLMVAVSHVDWENCAGNV